MQGFPKVTRVCSQALVQHVQLSRYPTWHALQCSDSVFDLANNLRRPKQGLRQQTKPQEGSAKNAASSVYIFVMNHNRALVCWLGMSTMYSYAGTVRKSESSTLVLKRLNRPRASSKWPPKYCSSPFCSRSFAISSSSTYTATDSCKESNIHACKIETFHCKHCTVLYTAC